jgi:hypothetical protein
MKKYLAVLTLLPVLALAQNFEIDTVGGSTYDWAANGPMYRQIVNDTSLGIHVTWMFSASPSAWPDRNMRYNFYDYASSQWTFSQGPTFLDWGVNSFTFRVGYGSLVVNPVNSCAYISAHGGATIAPSAVRDAAPGMGTFEECTSSPTCDNYQWPPMTMTPDEKIHVACFDAGTQNGLYYTRVDPWCTWSDPTYMPSADPQFPTQYIEASPNSNNVILSYVKATDAGDLPEPLYYRISSNSGADWDPEVEMPYPETYTPGSETIPSFYISGNSTMWDNQDNWHLVCHVMPVIQPNGYVIPSEIWHYTPANTPPWSKVWRVAPETLASPVGYNVLYCGRPMLGIDKYDNLYCVWEQFDSINQEPATDRLRADIFYAYSVDNGVTWTAPTQLTTTDATSHRFPSVARVVDDYVHVLYEQDLQAGFYVMPPGDMTENPYIYLKVPTTGIAEASRTRRPSPMNLTVAPNPFNLSANIHYALDRPGSAVLRIYDASGKTVKSLISGALPAGTGTAVWNGTDDLNRIVSRGVYFARLETPNRVLSQKVVFTR